MVGIRIERDYGARAGALHRRARADGRAHVRDRGAKATTNHGGTTGNAQKGGVGKETEVDKEAGGDLAVLEERFPEITFVARRRVAEELRS